MMDFQAVTYQKTRDFYRIRSKIGEKYLKIDFKKKENRRKMMKSFCKSWWKSKRKRRIWFKNRWKLWIWKV